MEIIRLWKDPEVKSELIRYERGGGETRPAMLVVPGGGYYGVCEDTEGGPVAKRFESLGFRVFTLHYRCTPHRFPEPQQDIFRAIRLIRAHAEEWRIRKDNIAVCGFSAGGHLCASAGVLAGTIAAEDGDAADRESERPDALLLSYPVITIEAGVSGGTFDNLLGNPLPENHPALRLDTQVDSRMPPAFLWHTWTDTLVPPENSLAFASAMHRAGVPCELHIFPHGPHGMQLGYGREDIGQWQVQALAFLRGTCGFRFPEPQKKRTVVLTFDDACLSQYENAVPVLKKYGFGATFFVCRFSDEWRKDHEDTLMTREQLRELSDAGFEIANHTWGHVHADSQADDAAAEEEIMKMERWLQEGGIPRCTSFAYPGGPYSERGARVLRRLGFRCARTVGAAAWTDDLDPMRVPALCLKSDNELDFYMQLARAEETGFPAVFVLHGVPDTVHPWVDTEFAVFERRMKYLADNGYRVISMRTACREIYGSRS